jgi:hypothetical protein
MLETNCRGLEGLIIKELAYRTVEEQLQHFSLSELCLSKGGFPLTEKICRRRNISPDFF